jgi:hypothetical protein
MTNLGVMPSYLTKVFTVKTERGCAITIKANVVKGNRTKTYSVNLIESKVRSKGIVAGPWASLEPRCNSVQMGLPNVSPYSDQIACTMSFNCDQERQYKFFVEQYTISLNSPYPSATAWKYFPSQNGWSEREVVDLGDISTLFN